MDNNNLYLLSSLSPGIYLEDIFPFICSPNSYDYSFIKINSLLFDSNFISLILISNFDFFYHLYFYNKNIHLITYSLSFNNVFTFNSYHNLLFSITKYYYTQLIDFITNPSYSVFYKHSYFYFLSTLKKRNYNLFLSDFYFSKSSIFTLHDIQ